MLPTNYTQLDYIESSGTQWIDTGFTPSNNTRISCDFQLADENPSDYASVFGERTGQDTNAFMLFYYIPGSSSIMMYGKQSKTISTGSLYERHTCNWNKTEVTIDGETLNFEAETFTGASNLTLAALNQPEYAGTPSSVKFYSVKIYENNSLVRDFIPCKNASGEIGLYDKANEKFYGNAGTGTFIAGPAV